MVATAQLAIPVGLCQCGCNQKTPFAKRSEPADGVKKGDARRFIPGHFPIRPQLPIEELKNLYAQFYSAEEIGKKFGISNDLVRRRLVAAGIKMRTPSQTKSAPISRLRRFWRQVNKNGGTPVSDASWTIDQQLNPLAWKWDGAKWVWLLGSCWEWIGAVKGGGYGSVTVNHKTISPHRFAYEAKYGPTSLHVCHHCDNRRCVNDSHLFAGTAQDNKDDEVSKGRHSVGLRHPQYKNISTNEIVALYEQGLSAEKIAKKFRVTGTTVVRRLRSAGISIQRKPRHCSHYRHDLSTKEIVRMYRTQSTTQIAAKLGTDSATVWHRLKGAGVQLRSKSQAIRLRFSRGQARTKAA
jgi:DNA invertase Pin-like site-specific DNA recombinase